MDYIVMKVRWGIVYLHISFFDSINFIIFKTFIKALFWRIYTINFYVTECGEGWYGTNCSQQCLGHCRDGTTCNHVTGQCDRGCDAGLTGTFCNTGNRCITNIILILNWNELFKEIDYCPDIITKRKLKNYNRYS